jgi:hypothetical protein
MSANSCRLQVVDRKILKVQSHQTLDFILGFTKLVLSLGPIGFFLNFIYFEVPGIL